MIRATMTAMAVVLGLAASSSASAQSLDYFPKAYTGKSQGDVLMRVRALYFAPDESADIDTIGGNIEASDEFLHEIDFTYFFTDNIAAELILASPRHDIKAKQTSLGEVDLGEVSLLPPVLTAQYHFMPDKRFSPYVGAGINYTWYYNDSPAGGTVTSIDYDGSFGWALQAGFDFEIAPLWFLNLDVKKIWTGPDVRLNGGAINADVDLDPWAISFGIGYKLGKLF